MRRLYPRERHQFVFGGVVAATGVVALLFFFTVYLPMKTEFNGMNASIEQLDAGSRARETELARLEALSDRLDQARGERARFLGARLIPRDDGFASMIPDLERLAGVSGITRDRATYNTSEEVRFGLHAVTFSMPVRGSYASLTRFIEELERADTFFILDSIQMRRARADEVGDLDLLLNGTTFFAQEP